MSETRRATGDAAGQVAEWLAAANAVALLRMSYRAGIMAGLAEPRTPAELARALERDPRRIGLVCQTLAAHGIVEQIGERYRVRPEFQALDEPGQPLLLREQVFANAALQRGVDSFLDASPGFGEVGDQESLDLARLAWGRPQSEAARALWTEVDGQMPEVVRLWEAGGSYAEFGCGAGRDLLRVAVMYPRARVTGHDVLPHLLEECRAQAEALGIADRVQLVPGDVTRLELENVYDTLMWSQMFFPPPVRSRALASIHRALVAGGFLLLPKMPALPDPQHTATSADVRRLLVARLAYARWQIQWDTEEALRAEVEASGFELVRSLPNPRTPYLLFRRV